MDGTNPTPAHLSWLLPALARHCPPPLSPALPTRSRVGSSNASLPSVNVSSVNTNPARPIQLKWAPIWVDLSGFTLRTVGLMDSGSMSRSHYKGCMLNPCNEAAEGARCFRRNPKKSDSLLLWSALSSDHHSSLGFSVQMILHHRYLRVPLSSTATHVSGVLIMYLFRISPSSQTARLYPHVVLFIISVAMVIYGHCFPEACTRRGAGGINIFREGME